MIREDNELHKAAKEGNLYMVRAQVRNFDINARGDWNETALVKAASKGHTEVIKLLLTFNADVNLPGWNGWTALMFSALHGLTDAVKELLKVPGIDVNHANEDLGSTALRIATHQGHTEIANLLRDFVPPPRPVASPPRPIIVPPPAPVVPLRSILKPSLPPPRLARSYVGPAIMSYRDTSRSVLASGRSVAAHAAAVANEERASQELALRLDVLCKRGQFPDLSAVTRVLAKPTGQSVVFEGMYKGQQVAVKVFRDRITADTAAKEVAYLQQCAHRHVLGTLNTYEFNGRALLVMPLAREDLQAVIEKAEGPLPHDQVTRYVKQVATALAFLHDEKRVAHLDLKAGNVFIAMDGRVMLADFGMAMDIMDVSRDQLLACGTPMFQAPELWAQRLGEPVQRGNRAKVDVYAFGCMVWQLLTRQLPFQREIENDGWVNNDFLLLATAVRRERRSPANMLETRWPEPLRRTIQACCAYDSASRPTMAEMLSKAEYLG